MLHRSVCSELPALGRARAPQLATHHLKYAECRRGCHHRPDYLTLWAGRGRKTLDPGVPFNEGTALAAQAFKAASEEDLAPYYAASQSEKAAYTLVNTAYLRQKAVANGEVRRVFFFFLPQWLPLGSATLGPSSSCRGWRECAARPACST